MKYIILILVIFSAHAHSCLSPIGEFSNKEELAHADSIFVASLAAWEELEETPIAPNIISEIMYDPLVRITFTIDSKISGDPLNSYFASICFGDFKKGEKYIFLAGKTRLHSYLENTQENINMINTYLKAKTQ